MEASPLLFDAGALLAYPKPPALLIMPKKATTVTAVTKEAGIAILPHKGILEKNEGLST